MYSLIGSTGTVEEIYSQSLCSRQISRNQLRQLQSISGIAALNPQQNRLIRRLLHASRRGWLNITD
ncbi:MAG: hypothetical protein M3O33_09300 [Cyanobacteriota bacterium]|nr:hypothetical protein [Cyanobacteriota bacterium]